MVIDVVKVFLPAVIAFCFGISLTPILTSFLYKHGMWKKKAGKVAIDGGKTPIFNELHKNREVGTPRLGGIIIWASATITIVGIWLISQVFPNETFLKLDFLSRNQTWIPLFTLIFGGLVGMIDDILEIRGSKNYAAGGLSLKTRLVIVASVALFVAAWFYFKLGVVGITIPVLGEIYLGWIVIPLFILITLGIYSGGVIDGLDGLAGGIFASMFAAYAGIAFYQDQINLAAFSALVVGAILAFLWFNIPPARFYMSETGTMGLTITLAVVAFMTDSLGDGHGVVILPIIAFPLVITTLSNILQLASKRYRGKKLFLIAPIHHHFEALGWPAYKVTMRFWVIGVVFAILGLILGLLR